MQALVDCGGEGCDDGDGEEGPGASVHALSLPEFRWSFTRADEALVLVVVVRTRAHEERDGAIAAHVSEISPRDETQSMTVRGLPSISKQRGAEMSSRLMKTPH